MVDEAAGVWPLPWTRARYLKDRAKLSCRLEMNQTNSTGRAKAVAMSVARFTTFWGVHDAFGCKEHYDLRTISCHIGLMCGLNHEVRERIGHMLGLERRSWCRDETPYLTLRR
jgi:hypothetical protein